jgi:hypothetical protein
MTAFGATTFAVALVVGAATILIGWRRPFLMLAVLILGVPLRDFATRWLLVRDVASVEAVTALGRWWFVLILALLGVVALQWLLQWRRQKPRFRLDGLDVLLVAIVFWGAIETLVSPSRGAGFTSLRGYLQPIGVFLIARELRPGPKAMRGLLVAWLALGALMAAFGLWQGATWTEETYRAEGYVRQDGSLVVPPTIVRGQVFIRPASTVSGPNELGVDMVLLTILAVLAIPGVRPIGRVALAVLAAVFTLMLGVTFSRSAMLAYLAAWAAMGLLAISLRRRNSAPASKPRWVILGGALAVVVLIAFALVRLGVFSVLASTITNLTSEFHYVDTVAAIQHLIANPGGVGMGMVEPKGAISLIEMGGLYHVEGSLFQIAEEMGVWGLGLWLLFWAVALVRVYRTWPGLKDVSLRTFAGAAFAGWLGSLVAFLFLPLMQSISLMVWLWFLLGIAGAAHRIEASWASTAGSPSPVASVAAT